MNTRRMFRLTDREIKLLDDLADYYLLSNRSVVLRFLIQQEAQRIGLTDANPCPELTKGRPKKSSRKS